MVAGQKAEWRDRHCAVELFDFAVRGVKKWGGGGYIVYLGILGLVVHGYADWE